MRTEVATPADQRFLMLSSIVTDSFVAELDSRHIPESMARSEKFSAQFKDATARYLERGKCENRIWCFTLYAYADIPIGRKFDMLFELESRRRFETPIILQHAILLLDGFFPTSELVHGHKHICVFDFPDGTPQLMASVPKVDPAGNFSLKSRVGMCDYSSWDAISNVLGS